MVNIRKGEYFRVSIREIEAAVKKHHGLVTMVLEVEADEYRKTVAMLEAQVGRARHGAREKHHATEPRSRSSNHDRSFMTNTLPITPSIRAKTSERASTSQSWCSYLLGSKRPRARA